MSKEDQEGSPLPLDCTQLFNSELEGMRNAGGLPLQVRYSDCWLDAEESGSLIFLATLTHSGASFKLSGGRGRREWVTD